MTTLEIWGLAFIITHGAVFAFRSRMAPPIARFANRVNRQYPQIPQVSDRNTEWMLGVSAIVNSFATITALLLLRWFSVSTIG